MPLVDDLIPFAMAGSHSALMRASLYSNSHRVSIDKLFAQALTAGLVDFHEWTRIYSCSMSLSAIKHSSLHVVVGLALGLAAFSFYTVMGLISFSPPLSKALYFSETLLIAPWERGLLLLFDFWATNLDSLCMLRNFCSPCPSLLFLACPLAQSRIAILLLPLHLVASLVVGFRS